MQTERPAPRRVPVWLLVAAGLIGVGNSYAQTTCDISAFQSQPLVIYFAYSQSFSAAGLSISSEAQGSITLAPAGGVIADGLTAWLYQPNEPAAGTGSYSYTETFSQSPPIPPITITGQGSLNFSSSAGLSIFSTPYIEGSPYIVGSDLTIPACSFNWGIQATVPTTSSNGPPGNYPVFAESPACTPYGGLIGPIMLNAGQMSGTVTCPSEITGTVPLTLGGTQTLSWSTSPLPAGTTCQVSKSSVFPFAGGNKSIDGLPTAMLATFSPSTTGNPITLAQAAAACGVSQFDWQQTITNWPPPDDPSQCDLQSSQPLCLATVDAPDTILSTPPLSSFSDPPPSGYTYNPINTDTNYPFYYTFTEVPDGCAIGPSQFSEPPSCSLQIETSNGGTLNFADYPSYPLLPGGQKLAFTTSLVGVEADGSMGQTFFSWTWTDTYKGDTGGIKKTQTFSSLPLVGSGTGGVTITSINGVTQTTANVTCSETPKTLWPPNGNSVPITVSGNITPGTSALSSTSYSVNDSEGQVQPSGPVTLGAGGSYSFTIPLIAARLGNDQNGRTYTISVRGTDAIGNVGSCSAVVTVPHDQGK